MKVRVTITNVIECNKDVIKGITETEQKDSLIDSLDVNKVLDGAEWDVEIFGNLDDFAEYLKQIGRG